MAFKIGPSVALMLLAVYCTAAENKPQQDRGTVKYVYVTRANDFTKNFNERD